MGLISFLKKRKEMHKIKVIKNDCFAIIKYIPKQKKLYRRIPLLIKSRNDFFRTQLGLMNRIKFLGYVTEYGDIVKELNKMSWFVFTDLLTEDAENVMLSLGHSKDYNKIKYFYEFFNAHNQRIEKLIKLAIQQQKHMIRALVDKDHELFWEWLNKYNKSLEEISICYKKYY